MIIITMIMPTAIYQSRIRLLGRWFIHVLIFGLSGCLSGLIQMVCRSHAFSEGDDSDVDDDDYDDDDGGSQDLSKRGRHLIHG